MKSKSFHASDSALDSPRNQDDDSSTSNSTNRSYSTRRVPSNSRHSTTKPTTSYFKSNDRNSSLSNPQQRYVLFLDKTRMPTFYDAYNNRVSFTTTDVELWLRRLRILYQIDKGRSYGEVIDYILSILQFIPTTLLCTLIHIAMESYSIDEMMLNDIARARMFMLEEWAADGDPYRLVNLTDSYRTMSPYALASTVQQLEMTSTNINDETISTSSDLDTATVIFQFNIADSD
jgi:hypothetical protein